MPHSQWWTKLCSSCLRCFPTSPTRARLSTSEWRCSARPFSDEAAFSIASARQGLFIEIAAECRKDYGAQVTAQLSLRTGCRRANCRLGLRRAAQLSPTFSSEFDLLVAARSGEFHPPHRVGIAHSPAPADAAISTRFPPPKCATASRTSRPLGTPGAACHPLQGSRDLRAYCGFGFTTGIVTTLLT